MIKYKLSNPTKELLSFDRRKTYSDLNIKNISKYLFNNYAKRVNKIKSMKTEKLNKLKELNFILVTKKKYYNQRLKELQYNDKTIKTTFIFLYQIATKADQETAKQEYERQKETYSNIQFILSGINQDLKSLNNIKKDFKKIVSYYDSINLSYDSQAKITLFDLRQLHKGNITQNIQECFYYYLTQFKKTKYTQITKKDIKPLFSSLFTETKLKELIDYSINQSFNNYLIKSINKRMETLESNILNKWL